MWAARTDVNKVTSLGRRSQPPAGLATPFQEPARPVSWPRVLQRSNPGRGLARNGVGQAAWRVAEVASIPLGKVGLVGNAASKGVPRTSVELARRGQRRLRSDLVDGR